MDPVQTFWIVFTAIGSLIIVAIVWLNDKR